MTRIAPGKGQSRTADVPSFCANTARVPCKHASTTLSYFASYGSTPSGNEAGTEARRMPWQLEKKRCNDDGPGQPRCRDHRQSKFCQLKCALDWRGSAIKSRTIPGGPVHLRDFTAPVGSEHRRPGVTPFSVQPKKGMHPCGHTTRGRRGAPAGLPNS
eukprot:357822-Chlamydomonas_euryale.AAC.4